MTPLELLRKKMQIHNRDCIDIPPEDEAEAERRELQRKIIQLQIECEEWRYSVRMAFCMCTTKTVVEVFDNLQIEKTRTVFKWEDFRDQQLEAIAEKELIGIEYLNKLIRHTYMTPKEKFEAGLRFTIPGNDIQYKLIQDNYGRDYVGFLNSGKWEYAFGITQVTDAALTYPDGEHGKQKQLLFNAMSFINA
ncbi:hypothetical protein [Dyadobacter sp. 676]|uniref:Uncharacterized protein n=1 Tax=Dyadobacter sp. 676 TaxID=3088362 RepID=A0AAU8FLG9_9BACT